MPARGEVCQYVNCPYAADIVTIKVKLDLIDQKIDGIVYGIADGEKRMRFVETSQARTNGMAGQERWDFRAMMLVAMFVLTVLGLVASWIRDMGGG